MKVFTARHSGIWLGGLSVITARDFDHARELLLAELSIYGLDTDGISISELDTTVAKARVLDDGDY